MLYILSGPIKVHPGQELMAPWDLEWLKLASEEFFSIIWIFQFKQFHICRFGVSNTLFFFFFPGGWGASTWAWEAEQRSTNRRGRLKGRERKEWIINSPLNTSAKQTDETFQGLRVDAFLTYSVIQPFALRVRVCNVDIGMPLLVNVASKTVQYAK